MPVVSRGTDWVFGQMLKDLAVFLGVSYDPKPALSPQELIDKLDMVMSAAQRYVAQIPAAMLENNLRNRKRSIRALCYHIFRLEEAFLEVVEDGIYLTYDVLSPTLPPHLRNRLFYDPRLIMPDRRCRFLWGRIEDQVREKSARGTIAAVAGGPFA